MNQADFTPRHIAAGVLIAAVAAVLVAVVLSARAGVVTIAVFALCGAIARVFTPMSGAFVVRRRFTDVAVLTVLGGALLYLGLTTALV